MALGRVLLTAGLVVATAALAPGFEARASALAPQPPKAASTLAPQPNAASARLLQPTHAASSHPPKLGMTRFTSGEMAKPHARLARQASASAAAVDVALTLHSRASSTKKIYLDFNGYTVAAGDQWASQGIPAGTYGGFSIDGDPSTFNQAELDYITQVWTIVAEKYSPFDVDVTTEDPGDAALTRSTSGDTTYGSHVVFTDDQNARGTVCPLNQGCAGIAYIGVFNDVVPPNPNYKPAWVYTTLEGGSGPVQQTAGQAANAAAHEIGHNLGLDHDSTTGNDGGYYSGHDNWAPIMGSSNRAVQQFTDGGGYPNALTSSKQLNPTTGTLDTDDFDVMTKTGISYRPDNEDGTLGAQTSYTVDGVITKDADTDTFTVDRSSCSSDLTVNATGIGLGQALDIQLTVSGPGVGPTVFNPPSSALSGTPNIPVGMDASGTISAAAAGIWTVKVEGTGDATQTDYPDPSYGSVGQYHLTISGCSNVTGSAPGQPATVSATPGVHATTGTVSWTAPTDDGGSPVTGYTITGLPDGQHTVDGSTFSYPATGLTPGVTYDVAVAASNVHGPGTAKHANLRVATWAPTAAPTVNVSTGLNSATVSWTAPANPGQAVAAGWHVVLRDSHGAQLDAKDISSPTATGINISASPGSYSVDVYQKVTSDDGTQSATTTKHFTVPGPTVPTAPKIGTASSGASGGAVNAIARWAAPTSNGGSAITGYRVIAYKSTISGSVISATVSKLLGPSTRSYTFALPAARYKFRVVAYNAVGRSPYSAYSALVYSR